MADKLDTVEGTGGSYKELAAEARRKADNEAYGLKWPHNAIRLEIRAASFEVCHQLDTLIMLIEGGRLGNG